MKFLRWRRQRRENDLESEIQSHLQEAVRERMERGESREEAEAAVQLEFGNVGLVKEVTRDMWGWAFGERTAKQLRYSLRQMRRSPTFSFVAVLTLAVGIGANTAIFSVVNGVLLEPLPFGDSEHLVEISHLTAPEAGPGRLPQAPYLHFTYRNEQQTFEDVGMWDSEDVSVTGTGEPELVEALRMSDGLLEILRVVPSPGRTFNLIDCTPGKPETAMLSYRYWQRRFGGDAGIIGRTLVVDGASREIIGVTPQDFRFLDRDPALILPFRFVQSEILLVANFSYEAIGRLKPGVTLDRAKSDLARIIPIAHEKYPLPPGLTLQAVEQYQITPEIRPLKQAAVGNVSRLLWLLLGAMGIVLLVACANVANLFLVRAESRQQELAIRTALGAGWGRLTGELLLESMTFAVMGGMVGLALAYGGIHVLLAMGPENLPRLKEISFDMTVFLFTLGISLLAGLFFGIIPVLKYVRPCAVTELNEGGRTSSAGRERHRARNGLVVTQIALALVLLIGSGLMIRTFQALRRVSPGFVHPNEVLTLRIFIPTTEVRDIERAVRTHEQIMRRIEDIPGVESAGLCSSITMDRWGSNNPVYIEEFPAQAGELPSVHRYKYVSENYFATMGNPILAGRSIMWTDIYNKSLVVVVTENLAREYWGDPAKAIGKRIRILPTQPWREIIGVVGNVHDDGISQAATAVTYWPMLLEHWWNEGLYGRRSVAYAIRTQRLGTPGFMEEVQKAVWEVNPNLPLANVRSLEDILEQSMARTSFMLVMLGISSAVALLLGVVGIYAVISYAVSQRTREIGIRMALGAQQREVRGLFLRNGLFLTLIGLVIGMGAAVGLTHLLSALLFGVSAIDPVTFGAVSIILGAVALLAAYVPACRVSRVDPVEALRWE
jgi:predicted permease